MNTNIKRAPGNFAKSPARALAATNDKNIITQATIKTKRGGIRIRLKKTPVNQFLFSLAVVTAVFFAYLFLLYLLHAPGDAALRMVG